MNSVNQVVSESDVQSLKAMRETAQTLYKHHINQLHCAAFAGSFKGDSAAILNVLAELGLATATEVETQISSACYSIRQAKEINS